MVYNHFKMEGIYLLRDLLRLGVWFTRLDLKGAYLSVPVDEDCRRFLRFRWKGPLQTQVSDSLCDLLVGTPGFRGQSEEIGVGAFPDGGILGFRSQCERMRSSTTLGEDSDHSEGDKANIMTRRDSPSDVGSHDVLPVSGREDRTALVAPAYVRLERQGDIRTNPGFCASKPAAGLLRPPSDWKPLRSLFLELEYQRGPFTLDLFASRTNHQTQRYFRKNIILLPMFFSLSLDNMDCGLMIQTVVDCKTCDPKKLICAGGSKRCQDVVKRCHLCYCFEGVACINLLYHEPCAYCEGLNECMMDIKTCGTRYIEVEEEDDIIFECSLYWHARVENPISYSFEKVHEKENKVLLLTNTPYLMKKSAGFVDRGNYICNAEQGERLPLSTLKYVVRVVPRQGPKLYITRPPLPPLEGEEEKKRIAHHRNTISSSTTTTIITSSILGSFLILLIIAISTYIYRTAKRKGEVVSEKQKEYDEDMMQLMLH
ncbi:izumo sperm-egg fusion protein 1 [Pelobates fuscus]|uniref:izumo sperm-egg fusion protein 1 n=1 Tax=Pelobates fuscus TaxID=191477 RepID=UPI002FE4E92B